MKDDGPKPQQEYRFKQVHFPVLKERLRTFDRKKQGEWPLGICVEKIDANVSWEEVDEVVSLALM